MTRDRSKISFFRQLRWWRGLGDDVCPFVAERRGQIVGYGIIVYDGLRAWLTAGLLPVQRNCGLGTEFFRFLMREALAAGRIPHLEVLDTNAAGRRVYKKLGFVEITRADGIIVMRTRPSSPPVA